MHEPSRVCSSSDGTKLTNRTLIRDISLSFNRLSFDRSIVYFIITVWVCITSDEAEVNNRTSMRVSWALSYVGLIFGVLVWISIIATTVIMSFDE